jgi:AcrR family transcriptional regulator
VSEQATSRPRAPRGRGNELRGEVLRAAMDLLAETGSEKAVSVRAVAQRVGVSVASVYLHFADKQALVDAVCEEVFDTLHVRMREAAGSTADPLQALRAQGSAYVRFALDNPEHYRLVMMLEHSPGPEATDRAIAGGAFRYLVESVQRCLDAGVFRSDPVEVALALWAAVHGVAALLIAKPSFPWPDVDAFVERTVRMAGLGMAVADRLPAEETTAQVVARLDALEG